MHPEIEIMQYGTALLMLVLAVVLTNALLTLNSLISPHNPTKEKQLSYECGEDPVGSAWLRFNIRFYVVALVFVLFDVEMALVYPVAVIFKSLTTATTNYQPALIVFGELFFFLAVLFLGLIYIWQKGDLGWVRTFRAPADQGLRSWKGIKSTPMAPSEKSHA
ncbi:MAG TPA: NADH-quinone oxidoreductase subunit A [Planctomycetota bacterium]|nr:NADH-quinone oxidoreductase subunit A [Planctomycetota bacterium]